MGLESATYVNDLNSSNPVSGDNVSQGDDHIRLMKAALKATFPNASKAFYLPASANKSSAYSVLSTDLNKRFTVDASGGAVTLTLPTLASGDDGWAIEVVKTDSSTNAVTLGGTINGATNLSMKAQYEQVKVWWSGSAWYAIMQPPGITTLSALTAPASDDELAIYDLSATRDMKITLANLLKVIDALTAETAPAAADELALYDASASTADKITLENLFKVINLLTAETTLDDANDSIVFYDNSASAARKLLLASLFNVTRTITGAYTFSNAAGIVAKNTPKAFGAYSSGLFNAFNVASIVDNGTTHSVTFTTPMSGTSYSVLFSDRTSPDVGNKAASNRTVNGFLVNAVNSAGTPVDPGSYDFMVLEA